MPEVTIQYWAVLVAAASNMVIGSIWYAQPVFGKMWMRMVGKTKEDLKKGAGPIMLAMGIAALIEMYVLAHMVDYAQVTNWMGGIQTGFWLWLGFVLPAFIGDYLFAHRPVRLMCLNLGYQLLSLLVAGAILGGWQ